MDYMYSGPVLIVDLESKETEEVDLEMDEIQDTLGGAGITASLYEEHRDGDPIVIGTGIFTGSMAPGSALGILTAKSPITQKICHAPFVVMGGSELKYCGFSFLVIKGKAASPVYLWLHDGIGEFQNAGSLWGKDTWQTTDWIRQNHASPNIQLLVIGQAGEKLSSLAQIGLTYWGSGDGFGFGKLMGAKNLKAIAFRGLGEFEAENGEDFMEKSARLLDQFKESPMKGKKGTHEFCQALGLEDFGEWMAPLVHRYSSCFNCPYPCNAFVKYNEPPSTMRPGDVKEPGVLLTSLLDIIAFKQFGQSAEDTFRALEKAYRMGIEPNSAAAYLKANSKGLADLAELADVQIDSVAPWPGGGSVNLEGGVFSTWTPPAPLFGRFSESGPDFWLKRNALAYVTGICPIFMLMMPEYDEATLAELINLGYGTGITADQLSEVAQKLIG